MRRISTDATGAVLVELTVHVRICRLSDTRDTARFPTGAGALPGRAGRVIVRECDTDPGHDPDGRIVALIVKLLVDPTLRLTVSVSVAIRSDPPEPEIDHDTCEPDPESDPVTVYEPPDANAEPDAPK